MTDRDTETLQIRNLSGRIQKILETLDILERERREQMMSRVPSEVSVWDLRSVCGEESPDLLQDLELTSLTVPSPHLIRRCRKLRPKVTLNIGGSKHEVMWRLLEAKPRYGLV